MLKLAAARAVAIVGHTDVKNSAPLSIIDFIHTQRITFTCIKSQKNAFINILHDAIRMLSAGLNPSLGCQKLHDLSCGYM